MKRIILTGGGTAGHVTPNIALIPLLKNEGWDIHYIGTQTGIESELIKEIKDITYHSIHSGKLRRYVDMKNLTDPFKVMAGIGQSMGLIHRLKPDVIFSKGGFVSVPVVIGGWANRVPVVIHESDITPGLANRIAARFAKKICTTFPETVAHMPKGKGIHTGTPIRHELMVGNTAKGYELCGFNGDKPVMMIMGGSLGATAINSAVKSLLNRLTRRFDVVHICGKSNIDPSLENKLGYKQYEYLTDELPHIIAIADLVVSRAGANSIYEFLVLKKPTLLIPLPLNTSRGDQIQNAHSFESQGFSKVLPQDELTDDSFYNAVIDLYNNRRQYIKAMTEKNPGNSIDRVMLVISESSVMSRG